MESGACAIEIRGLTKAFSKIPALRGVDLEVNQGDFLVLFGSNGAGKTTLIKVLATLLRPTSGTVRLCGLDLGEDATSIRRQIGLVSHQPLLYDELTAYENLRFWGQMYDVPSLDRRIRELVGLVGLSSRLHERVRTFSRGMQQRVAIARALMHRPSIMLLDEPETGLDRHASAMLREILRSFSAESKTVIMTTHNLESGLEMGTRMVILSAGRIAYDQPRQGLGPVALQEAYQRYTGATP